MKNHAIVDMDNKCPSSTPSDVSIQKETLTRGKKLTPTSTSASPMPTEDDADASSVASSLSSIPLKDLKRILATQAKTTSAKKRKQPSGTMKTNTKKLDQRNTKTSVQSPKPATTHRKPSKNKNNNNKAPSAHPKSRPQPIKVQKSDKPLNGHTLPDSQVPPSKLSETKEISLIQHPAEKDKGDDPDKDEEEAACCLCHCGVDCSDRALFFPKDRKQELEEDEDYYFSMRDPFLPEALYDQNNALVYCDTCNRLYHQKCHFVPVLVIPRGDWNCLLCSLTQQNKTSSKPQQPWKKFCDVTMQKHTFTSPPSSLALSTNTNTPTNTTTATAKELQEEFERVTAIPKAQLWHRQLSQLRTFLKSQASNLRLASAALQTLTSTRRNRAHFSHSKKSQELAQTLVRLATAKWKIRSALVSLEDYRRRANAFSPTLLEWIDTHSQYQSHVFPHGRELYEAQRRTIPRTQEMQHHPTTTPTPTTSTTLTHTTSTHSIPTEIAVPQPSPKSVRSDTGGSSDRHYSPKTNKKIQTIPVKKDDNNNDDDDDDSGISLDDLKCCNCLIGDATDENDLLLCDGEGCYRAFHMKCVFPAVTNIDDEDWFCPLCCAISNLLAQVQVACMDEDWEHRRMTTEKSFRQHVDTSSLDSWAKADEVFPEAEWEYHTAMKLKEGKQDENTTNLLGIYLGEEAVNNDQKGVQGPIGSDSEDENDYSLFDEQSFEERRQRERREQPTNFSKPENDQDGDDEDESRSSAESTRSSQATLVEMSSVELEIDQSELEALSDGGASSADDETSMGSEAASDPSAAAAGGHHQRRSRRLRKSLNHQSSSGRSATTDLDAELDESNIIEGKRKRKQVDYRRLNDTLFGDLTPNERAKLDDVDDYVGDHHKNGKTTKKVTTKRIKKSQQEEPKAKKSSKADRARNQASRKLVDSSAPSSSEDENASPATDTLDQ